MYDQCYDYDHHQGNDHFHDYVHCHDYDQQQGYDHFHDYDHCHDYDQHQGNVIITFMTRLQNEKATKQRFDCMLIHTPCHENDQFYTV